MEKLSIIRQYFLGNAGLLEHVKVTEEYRRLMRILAEFDEALAAKLESNSELYELFEKFKRANDEVTAEEVETFLRGGYKVRRAVRNRTDERIVLRKILRIKSFIRQF